MKQANYVDAWVNLAGALTKVDANWNKYRYDNQIKLSTTSIEVTNVDVITLLKANVLSKEYLIGPEENVSAIDDAAFLLTALVTPFKLCDRV
jgi:hypothetical protein